MLLKNTKARLITINGPLTKSNVRSTAYRIKPGNNPSVDVPDELCDSAFVKGLIADGSLLVVGESKTEVEAEPSVYDDMSKADIVALCEAQEIEVGSRDTKADLIAKLEAVE